MERLDLKAIIQSDNELHEKLETVLVTLVDRIEQQENTITQLQDDLFRCGQGISNLIQRINKLEVWMHQEKAKQEE